jgi:hypothetical protein
MSHSGLWLRVTFDERGAPQLGYRRDVTQECLVCGHRHLTRHYLSTPLHALTMRRLEQLSLSAGPDAFECEQCGDVTPPAPLRIHTVVPLLGGGGIEADMSAGRRRWRVDRTISGDAQVLPGVDEADERWSDALADEAIGVELGRPLSIKEEVRTALRGRAAFTGSRPLAAGLAWRLEPPVLAQGHTWRRIVADGVAVEAGFGGPSEYLAGVAALPREVWVGAERGGWAGWLRSAVELWPIECVVEESAGFVEVRRDGDDEQRLGRWSIDDLCEESCLTLLPPADVAVVAVERALWLHMALRDDP